MTEINSLYIIGSGSQLFNNIKLDSDYTTVSGRLSDLDRIPNFPNNSIIIIFSDPPDVYSTEALMLSVINSISSGVSGVKVIYISSISAAIEDSVLFPYSGFYAKKKRNAENLLMSIPQVNLKILRIGNVFEHGGWYHISKNNKMSIFPFGCKFVKTSKYSNVEECILTLSSGGEQDIIVNNWNHEPLELYFKNIKKIPGLMFFYKHKISRLIIKLFSKILLRFNIYLPSPDDLHSFY